MSAAVRTCMVEFHPRFHAAAPVTIRPGGRQLRLALRRDLRTRPRPRCRRTDQVSHRLPANRRVRIKQPPYSRGICDRDLSFGRIGRHPLVLLSLVKRRCWWSNAQRSVAAVSTCCGVDARSATSRIPQPAVSSSIPVRPRCELRHLPPGLCDGQVQLL
jgi:hypothetical protein